jgi:hypothetical protein
LHLSTISDLQTSSWAKSIGKSWSPSSMHPEDETEKEGGKPGVNEDGFSEIEPFPSSLQDVSSLRITSLLTNIASMSLKERHGQVA